MTTMSGKTCVVTGATSGIGKETAAALAALGATVVIVARDQARGETARDELRQRTPGARIELLTADLSDLTQVRGLASQILAGHDRLDVLVNNAGVITVRQRLTNDGLESTFATNHLGPFLLTNLLRGRLRQSAPARIVTVSSAAHKQVRTIPWNDVAHGAAGRHMQTYPLTKLLNILFTVELARRVAGSGVTANCLHPGFVRTALGREVTGVFGALLRLILPLQPSPRTGAATSVYLASSPEVAEANGGYFARCRPAGTSALARDPQAAARLWALSEELCGLAPTR